jgi:hypothetical protein
MKSGDESLTCDIAGDRTADLQKHSPAVLVISGRF